MLHRTAEETDMANGISESAPVSRVARGGATLSLFMVPVLD
jgi:hypothetical protein